MEPEPEETEGPDMLSHITSAESPAANLEKRVLQKALNFRTGDIFRGTVVQRYPGGDVLVSARGRQFRAFTALDLKEGGRHTFQVRDSGSGIELKVLDGDPLGGRSALQLWASNRMTRDRLVKILSAMVETPNLKTMSPEARVIFKDLSRLLPAVVYRKPEGDGALWLAKALLGSGLFWENKVTRYLAGERQRPWKRILAEDLKGLLLSLDKALTKGDQAGGQEQTTLLRIREALHLIEQEQLLNVSSLREGVGWFWFLPGMEEEGFKRAEVFVEKGAGPEEIRLELLLELSRLGQVEAEVSVAGPRVGVKIWLEGEERVDFVSRHLSLLETALSKAGVRTCSLSCGIKERAGLNPFGAAKGEVPSIHVVI